MRIDASRAHVRSLIAAAVLAAPVAGAQNLVTNGDFDAGLADWTVEGLGNSVVSWSPLDADGSPTSGSIRLENPAEGASPELVTQCLNVTPGARLRFAADYLLEGSDFGRATLDAHQFAAPDCAGTPHGFVRIDGFETGGWHALEPAVATLQDGFSSVRVRLTVVGNGRAAQLDDVVVEELTGGCTPAATALCLVGDRYRVEAAWSTGTDAGQGQAVEINDGPAAGTGYFWFFDPANVEVVVKVLDACAPPFDRVWVFAGGLTNVEVELRVRDTLTGQEWTHVNPLNTVWETVADTDALDVCD